MTKVLVHGVPETADIWRPLVDELAVRGIDDVVTLSPPGFGAPVEDGWTATPLAYIDWLHEAIRRLDGPVDLLGHDWGAGHVAGVAAHHPSSIRSWAIDIAGLVHPDYQWHDAAQLWQTPDVGEQVIDAMVSMSVDQRSARYVGLGLDETSAQTMASALDPAMGRCMLQLYRGGVQPYLRNLGDRLAANTPLPCLMLNAMDDPYVSAALGAEVAVRLGARLAPLEGQSHWWMLSDPAGAADALASFWSGLDQD